MLNLLLRTNLPSVTLFALNTTTFVIAVFNVVIVVFVIDNVVSNL